tara:strand:+ start:118 stop:411 length:294 start_codon:yes stop_codon:yes gene_type:complete
VLKPVVSPLFPHTPNANSQQVFSLHKKGDLMGRAIKMENDLDSLKFRVSNLESLIIDLQNSVSLILDIAERAQNESKPKKKSVKKNTDGAKNNTSSK